MAEQLRVLIAEDSVSDAELTERELRQGGLDVVCRRVETSADFVAALSDFAPDLVLSDYTMPGFDGMTALKLAQEHAPGVPVVMVTGSVNEEIAVECMKAGAVDYLLKERLGRLAPAARRALDEARVRRDKQAVEEALRAAERRERQRAQELETILEAIPIPVWIAHDPEGRRITGNAAADRLLRVSRGANVSLTAPFGEGSGSHRVFRRGVPRRVDDLPIQRAARGEVVQAEEEQIAFADGSRAHLLVNATTLRDESGAPRGAIAGPFDISESARAQAEIRRQKELLQAIIDNAPLMIAMMGADHRQLLLNREFEKVLGYSLEDARAIDVLAANYPDPEYRAWVLGQIARMDGQWHEYTAVARDGRVVETAWCSVRVPGGLNLGIGRDVTELRRSELRLRQLSQAVEQSPVAVVITDVEGRIEYVNPRFSETTGYALEEVVGRSPGLLKSGETTAEEYRRLWETIASGGTWRGEFHNRRKDGSLFWEKASISGIRDPAGRIRHYLALKEDVSEWKQSQRELDETRQHLAQAQKMEAIGRLAGGVAHDFNNMLAVIRGHAELLEARLPPDHPSRSRVEQIQKTSDRAAALARQLLAFSRKQTVKVVGLQLEAVVLEAEKMLRRVIGEDVEMSVVAEPGLPPVEADPMQIEQVLLNLVLNARDAMPRGGRLRIEVSLAPGPGAGERQVLLCVSDTGCGMDRETLSHVFEPFFTTKEVGKGTGLGLATVYGIVSQFGGSIRVSSTPGKGTSFRVSLPAAPAATVVPPPEGSPDLSRGRGETVLLVEDEAGLLALAAELLESLGYRVLEAERAERALDLARRHAGAIDLLLTDVVMPGLNGRELARQVLALRPGISVVLMSGYASEALGTDGLEDVGPLLRKPFTQAELSVVLREALARDTH